MKIFQGILLGLHFHLLLNFTVKSFYLLFQSHLKSIVNTTADFLTSQNSMILNKHLTISGIFLHK